MNKQPGSIFSYRLINFGTGLVVFSVLLFWGGIFGMENSEKFSIGLLRIQDWLSFLGIAIIFLGTLLRGSFPKSLFVNILIFGFWLVFGITVGYLNGNTLNNIGFEARSQLYVVFGAVVSSFLPKSKVKTYLITSAVIIATAIIIQWILIISGINFVLISGGSIGNIFTLNVPLVRPGGGFHLAGVGLMLVIGPWSEGLLVSTIILAVAVIISQSKTYWILCAISLFLRPLVYKNNRILGFLKIYFIAMLALTLLFLVFSTAGSLMFVKNVSPIEKFTAIFTDSDIRFGVLDVRKIELNYVYSILKKSNLHEIFFGHGLGYIYHPLNAIFYRADIRDQEVLAMFVHNSFAWALLKFGVFGIFCIVSILILLIMRIVNGDKYQKQLGFVLVMLVTGSLAMGTFQDPLTAFIFGLLAVGKVKK